MVFITLTQRTLGTSLPVTIDASKIVAVRAVPARNRANEVIPGAFDGSIVDLDASVDPVLVTETPSHVLELIEDAERMIRRLAQAAAAAVR